MSGKTTMLLMLVALSALAGGCNLLHRANAQPPTEQSFRDAAEKYFLDNGYQKIADGQYEKTDSATGTAATEALEFDPLRLIKYDDPVYKWQGIVRRTTTTKLQDKEDVKESPFIMYWNAKEGKWEHLFGSDIPQPGK
jgi:hypothetical protein